MLKKYLPKFAVIVVLLSLVGCKPPPMYTGIRSQVGDTQNQIKQVYRDNDKPVPTVVTKNSPYVDTTPVSLQHPPSWLKNRVTVHGTNLPFDFFVGKVLERTGSFVHYDNTVNQSKPISMDYSGTVKGALQDLKAKSGYAYDIDNDTLSWSAFETKTYNIAFLPGTTNYKVGRDQGGGDSSGSGSSGGGSSGGSSSGGDGGGSDMNYVRAQSVDTTNQYSSFQGDNISVWKDLQSTLNGLVSKDGKVQVSEATTTVTVRDHPENVASITQYINNLNETLSKQVLLQVEVLEVKLDKAFQYGINWDLLAGDFTLAGNSANVLGLGSQVDTATGIVGNTTSYGIGIARKGSQSVLLSALKQQGNVSVVTQPRVVTLNNQVAEINISTETGYLANTTTTVSGQGNFSQNGLDPGTVISGFVLYLVPKIEGHNVYLQISSTISGQPTFESQTSQGATIQLPTQDLKRFNQRAMVPTGSTLVLSGFKQLNNEANKSSFFGLDPLGGKGARHTNTETVILITPTILGTPA